MQKIPSIFNFNTCSLLKTEVLYFHVNYPILRGFISEWDTSHFFQFFGPESTRILVPTNA